MNSALGEDIATLIAEALRMVATEAISSGRDTISPSDLKQAAAKLEDAARSAT